MESSSDRPGECGDDRPAGASGRASRRALLVLGGWLGFAGGRAALGAAPAGSAGVKAAAQGRLKLAEAALQSVRANIGRGLFGPGERDPIAIWSRRRLEARLELGGSKADRVAAAGEHLDEMTQVEQVVGRMHKAGQIDRLALMDAEYRRLEAESWLERERASA